MTSSGPNSQSYNFTHMFPSKIFGCKPTKKYNEGSIMYLLDTHPDFSIFCTIVKISDLDVILDNIQANFTLFVPSDSELKYKLRPNMIENMDVGTARDIVKSSMLVDRIPSELLVDSPAAYFNTDSPQNRMFITNINGNMRINNTLNVILFDIVAKNGMVHVVDGLINPLQL